MVYPQVELTPSLQDELPLSHHDLPEGANFVDLEPCAALNTCLPVKSLCCSHIPSSRKCRRIVTDAYITCLKNVIRSPNNLFFHAKLLLFPKYVKLSQSLLCISRARNYKNASLYEIADAILNSAPKVAHSDCIKTSDGSCIRKAKRLISLGRLSDAIKSLDSFGLHQYSEEIIIISASSKPNTPR
jgi:hypothetical protein